MARPNPTSPSSDRTARRARSPLAPRLGRAALGPVALALGTLALGLTSCGGGDAAPTRPNVLLITLDTTRADRLSVYGGTAPVPTLQRLADEGTRFDRCMSTAGITPMSHSSILTGLNNYNHGLRVFHSDRAGFRLPLSITTLPEVLSEAGYRTAATVSSYPVSEFYQLNQGFSYFSTGGVEQEDLDLSHQQRHETSWDTSGLTNTQRRGDRTVEDALGFLDREGRTGDPWMLWVHLFDVHDYSLVPPADFGAEFGIEYPAPGTQLRGAFANQWRETMYDPELVWMDRQIARLVEWVEAAGQWEDTIVVVTADHGQGLMDGLDRHGWVKHRLLYDWSVHVPLILRVPGRARGATVAAQVRTIDIVPTVLEAVDLAPPGALDGSSLLALAEGGSESEPRIAYADALNLVDDHAPAARALPPGQHDNLYCACDGRWKFTWHETHPEASELYDLQADPRELTNLYAPDHPEAQRLLAYLTERRVNELRPPEGGPAAGPDASVLQGLGYGGDDEEDASTDPADGDSDGD